MITRGFLLSFTYFQSRVEFKTCDSEAGCCQAACDAVAGFHSRVRVLRSGGALFAEAEDRGVGEEAERGESPSHGRREVAAVRAQIKGITPSLPLTPSPPNPSHVHQKRGVPHSNRSRWTRRARAPSYSVRSGANREETKRNGTAAGCVCIGLSVRGGVAVDSRPFLSVPISR
eukprot:1186250-Prorocentrum_minimum.AAC.8